jgi:hypothetical protein
MTLPAVTTFEKTIVGRSTNGRRNRSHETLASIDVGKQASGIDFWKME